MSLCVWMVFGLHFIACAAPAFAQGVVARTDTARTAAAQSAAAQSEVADTEVVETHVAEADVAETNIAGSVLPGTVVAGTASSRVTALAVSGSIQRHLRVALPSLGLADVALGTPSPITSRQAAVAPVGRQRTDVLAAFLDSLKLLTFEHGIRVAFQEKTRSELSGPFWSDYKRSVRIPRQWEDSDSWWVNYVGHPIHGAAAGYTWIDNGPEVSREIGLSPEYWAGRARTLAWAAGYSLQFELGPLSEASIGNVGMRPETTGWVDHVVTPVGAFGLIVAEDALDRFFVKWIEGHTPNRFLRATLRLGLNPARTMSNVARGRVPWHREGRPIGWTR